MPKINIENPIVASTKLDVGEINPRTAKQNDKVWPKVKPVIAIKIFLNLWLISKRPSKNAKWSNPVDIWSRPRLKYERNEESRLFSGISELFKLTSKTLSEFKNIFSGKDLPSILILAILKLIPLH